MRSFLFLLVVCLIATSCVWNDPENDADFLPLDDSEYPFANLPRLVIETEGFKQIRNRETKIPARLQIWGKDKPESEILDLTIRGRGNSSFTGMPKVSYKIKFSHKQTLFGMPKDKEWALIANSADKTLLKNFITYKLAGWLGDDYTPRTQFVELYLNRHYMGIYLLTETVKVATHRVKIEKNEFSYLLELGSTTRSGETHVITRRGTNFNVKFPKVPTDSALKVVQKRLIDWEYLLYHEAFSKDTPIEEWIDVEEFLRYYWIQELTKNYDGAFRRSIYITWERYKPFRFGPVWDFDVAFGNWFVDSLRQPEGWYVRNSDWNKQLLQPQILADSATNYWHNHHDFFTTLPDSISKYSSKIKPATKNEFKRWPVLENTENWTYKEAYSSYEEAIDSLNSWIKQRIQWIEQNL